MRSKMMAYTAGVLLVTVLLAVSPQPVIMTPRLQTPRTLVQPEKLSIDVGFPKPDYTEYAKMVRWLVHQTLWGVLSTTDRDSGRPMGHMVSHSDGSWKKATGRIFMYLTPRDDTTLNLKAAPECAYSVTEAQLSGGCGSTDPEDPTCAKVTILGKVLPVPEDDIPQAKQCMFPRHPAMPSWPADHNFTFYELHLEEAHLLDWYGGVHVVTSQAYYDADLSQDDDQISR